ncbi:hypothetical protein GH714_020874 [Hevea brasiliensis]|uniref:Bulb-type lectin domain-containing protein n=1 Tax=Hevea brasiliensis TaxID=3981 RepID=A0A6A6MU31_HEVBR|nr:hypothetical protein GH714_020874 [Hevea brasiliensis]
MTTSHLSFTSTMITEPVWISKVVLHSSLLVLHFAFSSSKDTITINQTIHDGDFLISRENNFALGFFSPRSSRFRYLGIWYRKVREQTVVWVANRDDPINGSSGVLSIDQYGNLVLRSYHNQKVPIWSTNVSVEVTDTCVAQLGYRKFDFGHDRSKRLLKKLIWHEKDGKWNEFRSMPKSTCDPYGHCGTYGICDPDFLGRRFECDCLPGSLGNMNMSPRDCERNCRSCSCSAYASIDIAGKETGCLTWYGKLMDTAHDREEGYDIYVRVDAVELAEIAEWNGFLKRKDMLAVSSVCCFACENKWNKRWLDTIGTVENQVEGSMSHPEIAFFNLSTILAATNSFSPANKLGQGGFGVVYKGKLSNGKEVAVKRLSKDSARNR